MGFATLEGRRSNGDRRWRNHTEWRTSPDQPRQSKIGSQFPSCPSSSTAPSGHEHRAPLTGWGCVRTESWPFPLDSFNEHGIVPEMSPKEYAVSSPDVFLRFLEPCIRTQDIYLPGWSAQCSGCRSQQALVWTVSLLLFSIISAFRNPVGIQGRDSAYSALMSLVSLPFSPQKIHHREILHHDDVRTGKWRRYFQYEEASGSGIDGRFPTATCSW